MRITTQLIREVEERERRENLLRIMKRIRERKERISQIETGPKAQAVSRILGHGLGVSQ